MQYSVKLTRNLDELPEAREIRTRVFVEEQGFVNEFDEIDRIALHIVLFDGEKAIAVGRLFSSEDTPCAMHIGRVAVLPEYRGRGLGAAILKELEDAARAENCHMVELSAQIRVSGFYEALGYCPSGEPYLDEYCPHILMKKAL